MNFNENLIRLRKKIGLSQEELGNELNVARQTVSKWELGETTPEMGNLIELSKLFDISIDELVGNKEFDFSKKKRKFHYEYKSKKTIKGVPIIHINIGLGNKKAKGIIAIGNIAQGFLAIGILSMGIFSMGGIGLGIFTIAGLALGILVALGGMALGSLAIGGISIGIFAIGGIAIGIYSIGGCAIAQKIAYGDYAYGNIAIGNHLNGDIKLISNTVSKSEITNTILRQFPHTWNIIVSIFSNVSL